MKQVRVRLTEVFPAPVGPIILIMCQRVLTGSHLTHAMITSSGAISFTPTVSNALFGTANCLAVQEKCEKGMKTLHNTYPLLSWDVSLSEFCGCASAQGCLLVSGDIFSSTSTVPHPLFETADCLTVQEI